MTRRPSWIEWALGFGVGCLLAPSAIAAGVGLGMTLAGVSAWPV